MINQHGAVQVETADDDVIIRRFDVGDMYFDANRDQYVCPTESVAIPVVEVPGLVDWLRKILDEHGIPQPDIIKVDLKIDLAHFNGADYTEILSYMKQAIAEVLQSAMGRNRNPVTDEQITEMVLRILHGEKSPATRAKEAFTAGFTDRMASRDVVDAMCERLLAVKYTLFPPLPRRWDEEGFVRLTFAYPPPPGIAPEALAGLQYTHALAFREMLNRFVRDGKDWEIANEPPNTTIYRRKQQS